MDSSNRKRTADVASEHLENNTANTKHIKCEAMPASTSSKVLDASDECSDDTESYSSTVILSSDDECSDQEDEDDWEGDGSEGEMDAYDYEDCPFVYPDYFGYRGFGRCEAENPSEVERMKWLKHPVNGSPVVTGKWKMFFPGHVIDQRWKEAKELFQSGNLPKSITQLLVSTRGGSSGEGPNSHCILFCCAPENREATINIGTNLMLAFAPADEVIWFKNDTATAGEPQLFLPCENCRVSPPSPFGKGSPKKICNVLPSYNNTDKWMTLNLENTYAGGGKWIFRFSEEDIDRKWLEVKALAEKKELVGVKEVVISTKRSKTDGGYEGYVVLFVCGPADEEESVMVVGRNLLKIFPPCSSQEMLYYKSTEQSIWKSETGEQGINHLYKLPCKDDPTD